VILDVEEVLFSLYRELHYLVAIPLSIAGAHVGQVQIFKGGEFVPKTIHSARHVFLFSVVGCCHVRRFPGYWPQRPVHLRQHGQDKGPKGYALDGDPWAARLLALFVCEATADIRVDVRRGIVDVQAEEPVVRAAAPIAAVNKPLPIKKSEWLHGAPFVLDPRTDHPAYLVRVSHPDIQSVGGDVAHAMGLADEVSEHLDFDIQIEERARLLPPLPRNYGQAQHLVHGSAHFGAQQVPLDPWELVQNGMCVGVQLFEFGQ
jgi:hypothetical protein